MFFVLAGSGASTASSSVVAALEGVTARGMARRAVVRDFLRGTGNLRPRSDRPLGLLDDARRRSSSPLAREVDRWTEGDFEREVARERGAVSLEGERSGTSPAGDSIALIELASRRGRELVRSAG